jgi:hypothetical protein
MAADCIGKSDYHVNTTMTAPGKKSNPGNSEHMLKNIYIKYIKGFFNF